MATERRSARSSRSSGSGRSGGERKRGFFRGDDGARKSQEELERQKAKAEQRKNQQNMPFRFRVPVGETREAVILDDKPDFYAYEHNLKGSDGFWNVFTGCTKDWDNCPVCESSGRESYYAMYLTVLDLEPFTTRNGDEVEFSRKLLVVKPAQHKKFLRFHQKEGTLRGALFEFTRDGEKDSSIGNEIEFVEFMDEDELATYTREYVDKEKKRHTEDCSVPFVYEDLFEEPDSDKLRAFVGGKASPGSREEEDRELGRGNRRRSSRDDGDGGQEERGSRRSRGRDSEKEERGGRSERSSRKSGRGDADMDDWQDPDTPAWEGEEGDDQEEKETRSTRRGGRSSREEPEERSERGSRRGSRKEEPEEKEERSSRRSSRREEPEDEPEDEPEERGSRRSSRRSEPEEKEERTSRRSSRREEPEEREEPRRESRRVQPRARR